MNKWFIINYCHFMGTQSVIRMYKPLPKNHLMKKNMSLMIACILGVGLIRNAVVTFFFVRSLLLAFFQSKSHSYSLKLMISFASPNLTLFLLMCPPVLSNSLLRHFCNSVGSSCLQNQGSVAKVIIIFVDVGEEMGFAELCDTSIVCPTLQNNSYSYLFKNNIIGAGRVSRPFPDSRYKFTEQKCCKFQYFTVFNGTVIWKKWTTTCTSNVYHSVALNFVVSDYNRQCMQSCHV